MKNIINFFAMVALFLCATLTVNAQEWETNGNEIISGEWFGGDPNSNEPVRFEHRANEDESRFEWRTHDGTSVDERMRLTRDGWLGLNIPAPDMMFHVEDGGILSTGTTGTNPDLGAGTRMMWLPDR